MMFGSLKDSCLFVGEEDLVKFLVIMIRGGLIVRRIIDCLLVRMIK